MGDDPSSLILENKDKERDEEIGANGERKPKRRLARFPTINADMWKKVQDKALYPIQLKFEDLTFSVPDPDKKKKGEWKTLLRDISGAFEPGTLTAIMGSSGAGKSTLLNVLAGRAVGKIDGKIIYNGNPRENAEPIMKHQCYVMQDDILMKTQTSLEVITFSALLRIPRTTPREKIDKRIGDIMDELNITHISNTQVGAPGVKRGVSGGERKRIAIGCELVTNPSLIFLDEPTSGLDSFTAENVIESLHVLAGAGRTIICTIHQPNSIIYQKFDRLILLAKGRLVYNGAANGAVDYFASVGYQCPPYTNPADFFIKLIHIDHTSKQSAERVEALMEAYTKSSLPVQNRAIETIHVAIDPTMKGGKASSGQNVFGQMFLLAKRQFKDLVREPLKVRAQFGQTLFISILVGLIYLQISFDQEAIQDRLGAMFFILTSQSLGAVTNVVTTFGDDKAVFLREHSNSMYRTSAYYLSKISVDLIFQFLFPFIASIISYFMIGFINNGGAFIVFALALILSSNIGSSLGLIIGIMSKDVGTGTALVPIVVIPFMIFSGFFINSSNVPDYFIWCQYISFMKYAFQAMVYTQFENQTFTCKDDEKVPIQNEPGQLECRIPNGATQLNLLDFNGTDVGANLGILFAMWVGLRITGFICLMYQAKKSSTA